MSSQSSRCVVKIWIASHGDHTRRRLPEVSFPCSPRETRRAFLKKRVRRRAWVHRCEMQRRLSELIRVIHTRAHLYKRAYRRLVTFLSGVMQRPLPGLVFASDVGTHILQQTQHRFLTGPRGAVQRRPTAVISLIAPRGFSCNNARAQLTFPWATASYNRGVAARVPVGGPAHSPFDGSRRARADSYIVRLKAFCVLSRFVCLLDRRAPVLDASNYEARGRRSAHTIPKK